MKKILGVIAGLVVVYGATSFTLGFIAGKSVQDQVDYFNQTTGASNGVKLEVNNYSRGILSSSADITIELTKANLPNPLGINSHVKIQHGPLLTLGGFGFGSYATESTLQVDTGNQEYNDYLLDLFGGSIGLINVHYGFDQSYKGQWEFGSLEYAEDGTEISIGNSSIDFSGNWKSKKVEADIRTGLIKLKNATTDLQVEPFVGRSTQYQVAENLPVTNLEISSAKIAIATTNVPTPLTIENIKLVQAQKEDGKTIDTKVALTADKLVGPVEIKNAYYIVEFNNLPILGLQAFQKSIAALNNTTDPFASQQILFESLPELLADGVEFKLGLGSDYMNGKATADFNLVYQAPADGSNLMTQTPDQLLALFTANLDVLVSESILATTPFAQQMAPLVGTYITQENGNYKLNANLKNTQLTIGSQVMPAEQYMPLLVMAMMGMSAQQELPAGEHTHEEDAYEEEPMDESELKRYGNGSSE